MGEWRKQKLWEEKWEKKTCCEKRKVQKKKGTVCGEKVKKERKQMLRKLGEDRCCEKRVKKTNAVAGD